MASSASTPYTVMYRLVRGTETGFSRLQIIAGSPAAAWTEAQQHLNQAALPATIVGLYNHRGELIEATSAQLPQQTPLMAWPKQDLLDYGFALPLSA